MCRLNTNLLFDVFRYSNIGRNQDGFVAANYTSPCSVHLNQPQNYKPGEANIFSTHKTIGFVKSTWTKKSLVHAYDAYFKQSLSYTTSFAAKPVRAKAMTILTKLTYRELFPRWP